MSTTDETTRVSGPASASGNHDLTPGMEAAVAIVAIAVLILTVWLCVVAYRAYIKHMNKNKGANEWDNGQSLELGQRARPAGVNAGHGAQDLGILQHEIQATKREARSCVCM
ncbi:uncharacterized protein RCC_12154 [Ramularia collo-cygni]|uniref:Uncharacterized protein n=1 Tax=Ramularia collo-cygni TaxID=112498 RepID=A0A2D3VD74_9PEZI|nr:uncharacterized protein RCC_12154 [Ramularia collo-cygni]CZT19619.1 uncharacterized protein RCC_12154 [Ramularia collo-cygni]